MAYDSLRRPGRRPAEDDGPIRLVNPRFVGRDDKGRAFVLTAALGGPRRAATIQRVMLDQPALVLDEDGREPDAHLAAKSGVYHEGTRKLRAATAACG